MKKRGDPLGKMLAHQANAAALRKELLNRLRDGQRKPSSTLKHLGEADGGERREAAKLDVESAIAAAQSIRLIPFEVELGTPAPLNFSTLTLLRRMFECLAEGTSASVLQWPFSPRDTALLHPLAMVALIGASERRVTGNYKWCEPARSCRTLYFPWRGGVFYAGQRYLIRRSDLTDWNKFHLTRRSVRPDAVPTVQDRLHETLGHLTLLRVRETTKPHLAHPVLSELYPIFVGGGGDRSPAIFDRPQNELFGRVRFGAGLDRLTDHRAELTVPETAPYGLFGVPGDANFRQVLANRAFTASGHPPHICIIDLCPTPLSRLGPAWADRVEEFVSEAVKRFPALPFFAVTQDPFVHRKVESILRNKVRPVKPASYVQVRVSTDALSPDQATSDWSLSTRTRFSATAGPAADAIAALSEAARGSSDVSFAGTLRREMGALRKAASLPCGLAPAYDILCQEVGQAAAETFLERRSVATLLAPIDDALASEIGGAERGRLITAREAVDSAFKALDEETPIGSLTAQHIASILRKSSHSIVVFTGDMELRLATRRFANDSEHGNLLKRRLEKQIIRFTTMNELAGFLTGLEKAKTHNHWKRLLLVAPSANQLAALVTAPWLPDELFVICERTFADRLAETYQRLAAHPDLSETGLGARLAAIAQAAKAEVVARGAATIDLTLESANPNQSDDSFIDLIDDDDAGYEEVILTLASGRRLRARQGSAIIRYNQDAEFNPFERAVAKDVLPPQSIVVPNSAFIAEAREILPIRVLAERWVDVYHTMVEAGLSGIKGDSLSAKARTVLADMKRRGAGASSLAAVSDWLKATEHRKLPPEQRRPHAPQSRSEFVAFAAAIGIDSSLTEKMWLEGIQQLRVDRRRAGQRMAQAFISVLVDPHGTTSHFTKELRESIGILRKKALDHLDQVTGRELRESEHIA